MLQDDNAIAVAVARLYVIPEQWHIVALDHPPLGAGC